MNASLQEHIIEKATSLFYRYGIRSITMDFISSELGISKRTLYENFTNKEELVLQCMERSRNYYHSRIDNILKMDVNPIERIMLFSQELIAFMNATSRTFRKDVKSMYSKVNREYEVHRQGSVEYIRSILQQGVDQGLVRNDLDLDLIAEVYTYQDMEENQSDYLYRKGYTAAYLLQNYMAILLRGIATPQGAHVLDELLEKNRNTIKK